MLPIIQLLTHFTHFYVACEVMFVKPLALGKNVWHCRILEDYSLA